MTEQAMQDRVKRTATEATNALSGYQIIALEDKWNLPFQELAERYPMRLMMGLVFAERSRVMPAGMTFARIWDDVMKMTIHELNGYFEPEPDDAMPDEPDSAAGKDSYSQNGARPILPRSVLRPESDPMTTEP